MAVSGQIPQEELGKDVDRCDIQVDQCQFLFQIGHQERSVHAHARVIDHKIDVPVTGPAAGFPVQTHAFLPFGEIRRDHDDLPLRMPEADLPAQLSQEAAAAGCDDQIITFFRQIFGNFKSDAGAGASDKCVHMSFLLFLINDTISDIRHSGFLIYGRILLA